MQKVPGDWYRRSIVYCKQNRWLDYAILGVICFLIVLSNIYWIQQETRPPHWDMARHLYNSTNYLRYAENGLIRALVSSYSYYPPLLYWVAIPFYWLFGEGVRTAVLSNVVFIVILVLSTYGIGSKLWNRHTGMLAALLIVSAPIIVSQFKEYQLDAPATAMVALSLYTLIRTEEFKNRWWGILLGLVVGLSLLTKWTLVFVIILPVGYAIAQAAISDWRNKKFDRLFTVLSAGLLTYAVASVWYLPNNMDIQFDLLNNNVSAGVREGDPPVGSLAGISWYISNLVNSQLYLVPMMLFFIGSIFSLKKPKELIVKNIYPWLLVINTFVFFTLLRNKDARYTLPMLVGVMIIAVFWISMLKHPWKKIVTIAVVAYSIASFLLISFGSRLIPTHVTVGPITVFAQKGYIIGPPSQENWYQQEIINYIANQPGDSVFLDNSGPDVMWFNNWANRYYSQLYGVAGTTKPAEANYALVRPGTTIEGWAEVKEVKRFVLPDGTELILITRSINQNTN